MDAGEDAGGEHGGGEARAFLVRPVDDDDGVLRLDVEVVHRAYDFETSEHAEHAVILAAGRLGVEMRADVDGQGVRVRAGARHEHVADLVDAHGEPSCLAPGLEEFAAFAIRIRQRLAIVAAGDAGADLRHVHEAVPQTIGIDAHVLARCSHGNSPQFSVSARHFCVVFASLFRPVFFSCFFTKSALRL